MNRKKLLTLLVFYLFWLIIFLPFDFYLGILSDGDINIIKVIFILVSPLIFIFFDIFIFTASGSSKSIVKNIESDSSIEEIVDKIKKLENLEISTVSHDSIVASTKPSFWSYGEIITIIKVGKKIKIKSELKHFVPFLTLDYGSNKNNIERVCRVLTT